MIKTTKKKNLNKVEVLNILLNLSIKEKLSNHKDLQPY